MWGHSCRQPTCNMHVCEQLDSVRTDMERERERDSGYCVIYRINKITYMRTKPIHLFDCLFWRVALLACCAAVHMYADIQHTQISRTIHTENSFDRFSNHFEWKPHKTQSVYIILWTIHTHICRVSYKHTKRMNDKRQMKIGFIYNCNNNGHWTQSALDNQCIYICMHVCMRLYYSNICRYSVDVVDDDNNRRHSLWINLFSIPHGPSQ